MSRYLTKSEQSKIVKGSISDVAKRQNMSLSRALFDADAVAYVDTSGSMDVGLDGNWFMSGGKKRHDQAQDDLEKLQQEFPGKLAVYAWSSDEPVWCPDGVPYRFNRGTAMRRALEHMKKYDDTGMALYLLSDGFPDDKPGLDYSRVKAEAYVIEFAKTFKSPIHTIFIGSEMEHDAIDFMRRLAEATGGRAASTKEVAKLYDPTKKFMLMDGIKKGETSDKATESSGSINL